MNKYRNRKTTMFGIEFDSKREAERYCVLLAWKQQGKIYDLRRQVRFSLIPPQYGVVNGKRKCLERECVYVADFVYTDTEGNIIVEDTKGVRTAEYIIKRKLMLQIYGITVREI